MTQALERHQSIYRVPVLSKASYSSFLEFPEIKWTLVVDSSIRQPVTECLCYWCVTDRCVTGLSFTELNQSHPCLAHSLQGDKHRTACSNQCSNKSLEKQPQGEENVRKDKLGY